MVSHVDEEQLHLRLGDPPAQTLARPKAEAQAPEVVALCPQPAGGSVLLRPGEHSRVPAHGIQTQLDQSLATDTHKRNVIMEREQANFTHLVNKINDINIR